jgi:hypothetical protein
VGSDKALTVTIRLLPEEREIYPEFKKIVTEKQHSDVCYVLTMLMKAYNQAVSATPELTEPIELKFAKQSVQINMGCTFQYYTKKARRVPQDESNIVTIDRKNLLPEIVNQSGLMSDKAKQWWIEELRLQGWNLQPPNKPRVSIFQRLWTIIKHLFRYGKRR